MPGISDEGENQQAEAPPFDQALVGKWIEVLWRYMDKATNKPMLIWSRGRISRVADGLTDTRSPRAKTVLPLGAVLWEWEADPVFEEPAGERGGSFSIPTSGTPPGRCNTAGDMTLASLTLVREQFSKKKSLRD